MGRLLERIFYFLRRAALNVRDYPLIHTVTIGTIAVSLLIFGCFYVLLENMNQLLLRWEQKIQITVYLKGGADASRESLRGELAGFPELEGIRFVSKREALEKLRKLLGEQAYALEGIEEDNPLPAAFQLTLRPSSRRPAEMRRLVGQIRALPGVDDVHSGEEWVAKLSRWIAFFKWIGLATALGLGLALTFIISNTIKLTVFSRREELEIMQLVGATDLFIKIPFLLEGLFQGFLGALLAFLGLFIGFRFLWVKGGALLGLSLGFGDLAWELALVLGGMGTGLGFLGSAISLGRFLRVQR